MHKLLLADDSVTIQRVVELTFAGEDVQVVSVPDGEQAIARIPTERPDVVLADIGMPRPNGYDVAAFVKGRPDLAHIPVLLLAGALEPVDQARADEVRCDGVLVKPFEPQRVIARVRELVNGGPKSEPSAASAATTVLPGAATAPRPTAPRTAPPQAPTAFRPPVAAEDKLGDYFDQLDAALANLAGTPTVSSPPFSRDGFGDADEDTSVPTLDAVLSPPNQTPGHVPSRAADTSPTDASGVLAEAFNALLKLERGEPGATPVRLVAHQPKLEITDDLVDELTRRVLRRLAPEAAHDLVVRIVSEVAERLVREEIARIRAKGERSG